MESSPSCSSTSPAVSSTSTQEADLFSDDSGVDVKPQGRLKYNEPEGLGGCKRNKRKSSEPKKRKDVLQMKRFRWDTDEEDIKEEEDTSDDVFDVLDGERPSSGDSGCPLSSTSVTRALAEYKSNKRRKPKVEGNRPESTTFRQSVICKNETIPCTTLLHPQQEHPSKESEDDDRTRTTARSPRNYKSMSRQRRIEANARERTRVHTISAAFESLRKAVPAYAHNQKLSKLAILRIASAYIVALACLNGGQEDSNGTSNMPDCVEQCTRTIQAEGRSRRRTAKD